MAYLDKLNDGSSNKYEKNLKKKLIDMLFID
jgi:hypothetical protein